MFAITKSYTEAAKAVAAIRCVARNKKLDITELDLSMCIRRVEGEFRVDNLALNTALGFVAAAAPEVAQAAVTVAAQGTLAASMLNMLARDSAKHAAEDKVLAQKTGQRSAKCVSAVQNGARRPAKAGKTATVWEVTERLQNAKDGVTPSCKEVYEVLVSMDKGFNKTTCNIQYYACLKFNGWENNRG